MARPCLTHSADVAGYCLQCFPLNYSALYTDAFSNLRPTTHSGPKSRNARALPHGPRHWPCSVGVLQKDALWGSPVEGAGNVPFTTLVPVSLLLSPATLKKAKEGK